MLCSKIKQILLKQSILNDNVQYRCLITTRSVLKRWIWFDGFLANAGRNEIGSMSALRFILKDFRVWSAWTRSNFVNIVVKKCRRDRSVREVIQCFKQTFLRPRRTLLLSATAAYKAREDDDNDAPVSCEKNITDEELKALVSELDGVETLSRNTLFCSGCGKRLVIEKKQPGVPYCSCKVAGIPSGSPDGWVPYMEAEDVIIWRKEYKPGLGLYAYKVYGRYPEVRASDFAAVQVDAAYRRIWDAAVAALAVVERRANGLADQAVLHWEVLWPRLFANRDYVYIRRHKEFDIATKSLPHKDGLFRPIEPCETRTAPFYNERPSVHSNAKRKALESNERERDSTTSDNKVYVIMSRSCIHPNVPETKHAIRVSEYWSHMVVKTINGPEQSGMEFVLTYYDEPAVGGMPTTVAAWATGRAAPAYLQRMRRAASDYRAWRVETHQQDLPEFVPFVGDSEPSEDQTVVVSELDMKQSEESQDKPSAVSSDLLHLHTAVKWPIIGATLDRVQRIDATVQVTEPAPKSQSSQSGPDLETADSSSTRDQGTQTEVVVACTESEVKVTPVSGKITENKAVETELKEVKHESRSVSTGLETEKSDGEEPKNGGWWRYLYPFYYFV